MQLQPVIEKDLEDGSAKANATQSLFQDQLLRATTRYVEVMSKFTPINPSELINMQDSAERMAKALCDILWCKEKMVDEIKHILKDSFPVAKPFESICKLSDRSPIILTQAPIRSNSMCPHHFLPVQYEVFIAIKIPTGGESNDASVFGLSKYSRAVKVLAKRPVLQEQYARDIVELFTLGTVGGTERLHTQTVDGCMVILSGSHGCMSCRGIESDTPTQTVYSIGMNEQDQNQAWNLYNGRNR